MHSRSLRRSRRGLAVVEAAITIPLIFVVILSTVEICNRIFLQQKLEIIAYEGSRVAIIPDSKFADVQQQVDELAENRGIKNLNLSIEPADFESAPEGTFISITVTAENKLVLSELFLSPTSTATVSMMKETE